MPREHDKGWEITTACDINLGAAFPRDNADYINIDSDAIAETLEQLEPSSKGKLLLTVVTRDYHEFPRRNVVGNASPEGKGKVNINVGILDDEKKMHRGTVHELQHAVDFVNPTIQSAERRANAFFEIKANSMSITSSNLLGYAAGYSTESLSGKLVPAIIVGVGTLFATALGSAIALEKKRKIFKNYGTPMEKRAYGTQDRLTEFPQAISFRENNA